MSILTVLPNPPAVDRGDLAGSLERFQRWAVDMRARVADALARADNTADREARPVRLPTATVADLAALKFRAGDYPRLVYVTDETSGPCAAYSDGADWRRVRDDVVVS